jgi:hypothetical protein
MLLYRTGCTRVAVPPWLRVVSTVPRLTTVLTIYFSHPWFTSLLADLLPPSVGGMLLCGYITTTLCCADLPC